VQIYVKSSALSRTPDLAISAHLLTEAEIDDFVNDAITELEEIRLDAKKALRINACRQAYEPACARCGEQRLAFLCVRFGALE
jgi:hypothetical protein